MEGCRQVFALTYTVLSLAYGGSAESAAGIPCLRGYQDIKIFYWSPVSVSQHRRLCVGVNQPLLIYNSCYSPSA
jgi:hypothetical protein